MESDFATILKQLISGSGLNLIKTLNYLQNHDVSVSYSALSTYQKGNAVPSFDRARSILDAFDYPIEDDDLREILNMSRSRMQEQHEQSSDVVNTSIRLRPEYFGNMSASDLLFTIRDRVKTFPEADGNMNRYINFLIRKDLVESGYIDLQEDK